MRSVFGAIYALCVEKIFVKNWVGGEKMTNIRYGSAIVIYTHQDGAKCISDAVFAVKTFMIVL